MCLMIEIAGLMGHLSTDVVPPHGPSNVAASGWFSHIYRLHM